MTPLQKTSPTGPTSPQGVREGQCRTHPPTSDFGARELLEVAAEIEAAERAIKLAILSAARAGDSMFIAGVVDRWLSGPVNEALRLASIKMPSESGSLRLEACPAPEVTQSSSSQPEDGRS